MKYLGVFCVVGIMVGLFVILLLWSIDVNQSQRSAQSPIESKVTATQSAQEDHELHIEPNLFGGGAVSDGRTYSVLLIDANKNKIPTGTELFVQGTLLTETWSQEAACNGYLLRGEANVQHGDDPRQYCRFSVLLTEKGKDGNDLWPSAALACDTTPQEMKEVARLYPYGKELQVHGTYAASLDFGAVPGIGGQFGVPALEDCTFADPTDDVVRLPQEAQAVRHGSGATVPVNSSPEACVDSQTHARYTVNHQIVWTPGTAETTQAFLAIPVGAVKLMLLDEDKKSTNDYSYAYEDLKGDGTKELFIQGGSGWCGSGGCELLVLAQRNGEWIQSFSDQLGDRPDIINEKADGYAGICASEGHDLKVFFPMSAGAKHDMY